MRATSYFYQPWFALVSGDVGLVRGTSRQSGGESASATASRNTAVTYGGNLNLFPQSRFPFQAYLQANDSRASTSAVGAHYTSTRFGATQSYRPETGSDTYSASADRSVVTSSNVKSVVDAVQGAYSTSIGNHSMGANARYSRNTGDVAGQGSDLLNLGGSHSWRVDEGLTVSSSANYTHNQIRMLTSGGLLMNNSQIAQAGSNFTWLPDEDLPLTITGGGNLIHVSTETETASAYFNSLNGYANANYRFNDNLTGMAGVTLSQNQGNGLSQFGSSQNASVSYAGNPLTFGDYSYNWGTGGGVSNQVVSNGGASRNFSGNVQHSVLRNFALSDASALTINAGQSFSLSQNSSSGQTGILMHSGGASWRLGLGERTLGMLTATASDALSTGEFRSHYRSLSAQGNVQTQLTGRSALNASLNFVLSQQLSTPQTQRSEPGANLSTAQFGQTDSNGGNTNLNGSGQIGYSHRSPFNISNLFYTATFQVNASQTNMRVAAGNPNAPTWQTGTVFQQNADYRLGRLLFRATNSLATINGKKNASIFFMISRQLGDL